MLVLSRQKNERIMIGRDVEICVVEIRGDKVRLGVSAPGDVAIDRAEVRRAKDRQAQQLAAANAESEAPHAG